MSLSINGRMTTPIVNRLRRHEQNLAKDTARVSGAQKIVGAADGASEFAISEKMRVQLRALDADVQNVKTGSNMVATALGGMQNIIDTLRSMKELAINAANDTNTDADRAIMEKEFEHRLEHIDSVAYGTNYNGKILLDGTYKPPLTRPTRPSGEVHQVSSGDIVIDQDGIYELESDYSGNIIITAQNVELRQAGGFSPLKTQYEAYAIHDAYVYCASAETNLWLKDMYWVNVANDVIGQDEYGQDIIDTIEKSAIRFHGTGNTLNIVGEVAIEALNAAHTATVHVGEGLAIYDSGDSSSNDWFEVETAVTPREDYLALVSSLSNVLHLWGNTASGAAIGTDYGEDSDAYIVIDMGTSGGVSCVTWGGGAGIGSGADASIGSIRIESGDEVAGQSWMVNTDSADWAAGAGIGSGAYGLVRGDIIINGGNVNPYSETGGAALGAGKNGTVQGNIIINDGYVMASSLSESLSLPQCVCGAAIGTGSYNDGTTSQVGGIYINGGQILARADTGGEAIGRGCLYLNPGTITAGEVGEIAVDGGVYSTPFGSGSYHTYERERQATDHAVAPSPETPLTIHYGTKAGQRMNVFIKSIDTYSIGLKEADVSTRDKAEVTIALVDCAVNYVATEATTMGAYLQRLETTENNIVLAHENTTAAESTIRDANMAEEMVNYAKDNILSQAAQAMLAQANNDLGRVVSLIREGKSTVPSP
ncbi:MAG: hypothetical protein IJ849_08090 [Selenomonadaceae bacterium]|nr:hypothetical protein [Selenomonadaceae bacterium]